MKKLGVIAAITVLLAGCGTYYHEALQEYRENEPTTFYKDTLQWTEGAQEAPMSATREMARSTIEAATPAADVFARVVADVIGVPTESAREAVAAASRSIEAGGVLTWRELLLAVAARSPAVQAAGERWSAAVHQYSQADFLETLIAEYRGFTRYLDLGAGKEMQRGMAKQFFPYPSTLTLKGELIAAQVRLAEIEWERVLRGELTEAGDAYFEYQYVIRAEVTTTENIRIVENLLRVIEEQYAAGRGPQAHLLRAQTELERQRNLLADLRAKQRQRVAELNGLLDRSADAALGRPSAADLPVVSPGLEGLTETALAHRQEVRMDETRVERTALAIRLGEVMNRPLATQGYSLYERGMMPEAVVGESRASFGEKAKVRDLPDYARVEAYLAEMRRRLAGNRAVLQDTQARTRGMARSWLERLDVAERKVNLVRDVVLPQNRSSYEGSLSAYSAGNVSFIDLFDAERDLLAARLELDGARRDQNQVQLRYAEVAGSFGALLEQE